VDAIRSDVETKEFKQHMEDLASLIGQSHAGLLEHLPNAVHAVVQTSSPRFGFFRFYYCRFAGHAARELPRVSPQEGHAAQEVLVDCIQGICFNTH